jgi:hypothetical protein
VTVKATHHGPWCDEEPREHACGACWPRWDGPRPGAPLPVGGWLLLRLVRYHAASRRVGLGRQEPFEGFDPTGPDRLELARTVLALAEAGWKP